MNQATTPVMDYMINAMTGSTVIQLADKRGISLVGESLPNSKICQQLYDEIVAFGIDPERVAFHAMASLHHLFNQEENAESLIETLTAVLWETLGDPDNGGSAPLIYKQTACKIYTIFMLIIRPLIPNP
jgi:hypothetical protein